MRRARPKHTHTNTESRNTACRQHHSQHADSTSTAAAPSYTLVHTARATHPNPTPGWCFGGTALRPMAAIPMAAMPMAAYTTRQFKNMFITPLYRQHASHTLASRAYGPQPHMRSLHHALANTAPARSAATQLDDYDHTEFNVAASPPPPCRSAQPKRWRACHSRETKAAMGVSLVVMRRRLAASPQPVVASNQRVDMQGMIRQKFGPSLWSRRDGAWLWQQALTAKASDKWLNRCVALETPGRGQGHLSTASHSVTPCCSPHCSPHCCPRYPHSRRPPHGSPCSARSPRFSCSPRLLCFLLALLLVHNSRQIRDSRASYHQPKEICEGSLSLELPWTQIASSNSNMLRRGCQ